jgi:hypothetical protein
MVAALLALLLLPFTVFVILVDGLTWLVRKVPALRRYPIKATWAGAFVVLVVLGSSAAAANPRVSSPAASTPTASPVAAATIMVAVPTVTAAPTTALATPEPSPAATPAPTTTPAPTPTPAPLVILKPASGATVHSATVTVSGTGPANEQIVRDIALAPDTTAIAGSDGTWSMQVDLSLGQNDLVFRVGDDRGTEVKVSLTYVKVAPVAKLGKPVTIDGIEITILKSRWSTGASYWAPPKGYIWAAYQIRLKAIGESRLITSGDWVALADGTRQGEWTITGISSWEPLLSLTDVRAGASTTGWIVFEMPRPKKTIELIYDPSFFSDEARLTLTTRFP